MFQRSQQQLFEGKNIKYIDEETRLWRDRKSLNNKKEEPNQLQQVGGVGHISR